MGLVQVNPMNTRRNLGGAAEIFFFLPTDGAPNLLVCSAPDPGRMPRHGHGTCSRRAPGSSLPANKESTWEHA